MAANDCELMQDDSQQKHKSTFHSVSRISKLFFHPQHSITLAHFWSKTFIVKDGEMEKIHTFINAYNKYKLKLFLSEPYIITLSHWHFTYVWWRGESKDLSQNEISRYQPFKGFSWSESADFRSIWPFWDFAIFEKYIQFPFEWYMTLAIKMIING